jgi:hypothetical protein
MILVSSILHGSTVFLKFKFEDQACVTSEYKSDDEKPNLLLKALLRYRVLGFEFAGGELKPIFLLYKRRGWSSMTRLRILAQNWFLEA